MPDGGWFQGPWAPSWQGWSGTVGQQPPLPPVDLGPFPQMPIVLQDAWGIYLADPAGNLIGVDTNWGRGGQLARLLNAGRAETRNL